MNCKSGKVIKVENRATAVGANIPQNNARGALPQRWYVIPVDSIISEDFSSFTFIVAYRGKAFDLLNWPLEMHKCEG